jgi:chromosome segregation protein
MDLAERRIKRENLENRCREYYHCAIAELGSTDNRSEETDESSPQEMEKTLATIRQKIVNIGDVNLEAIREFEEQRERYDFLCEQRDDLVKAIDGLHKVIRKINRITQERFLDTFNRINEKLQEVFPSLFEGGTARLELTNPGEPLETGVEFMVHPPGKKLTRMSLLSGGEKALSAISFIFSIFLLKPASFCLMDEIDAPLDDANVMRFNNLMKVIGQKSQIIMITHNKNSMEFADTLFGITMEQKGLSKVVSVNLDRDRNTGELTAA